MGRIEGTVSGDSDSIAARLWGWRRSNTASIRRVRNERKNKSWLGVG